jgi:hypothetical protein
LRKVSIINKGLQKKIERKFEALESNLETQLYNNFIKPSLNSIEKTMKTNMEEIKQKISLLSGNSETDRSRESFDHELLKSNHTRKGRLDNKLDEINLVGERLYEKLLEKVFI